ncbi:MAG: VWA domain-containing protein [Acidobacteriota bacterium]
MISVFSDLLVISRRSQSLGLLLLAALVAVPLLTVKANNYEILDQSFEFKTGGTVKIESGLGEIVIEVWAEELVHVTAKKVEPAGHAIALSDLAFFNTKNQLTIKSQPSDTKARIDMTVYVPRNTNLRIVTTSGAVQIRGAISSAMVETQTGNIKLSAPPSQDADLVLSTKSGTLRAELPIEPYGSPTTKNLQGKLGSGGNPVILRTTGGNIQIAALERELDQNVPTIPSGPSPSSSSTASDNYRGYGNTNDDRLFGNNDNNSRPDSRVNRNNSKPYSYGGSYGSLSGGNNSSKSNPASQRNSNSGNTDIFGGSRDTDDSNNSIDAGGLGAGRRRSQDNTNNNGGVGVRIIPPPGAGGTSRDQRNNDDDRLFDDNAPDQPPPLQPRKRGQSNTNQPSNNNDDQSARPDRDRDQQSAANDSTDRDLNDAPTVTRRGSLSGNRGGSLSNNPPTLQRRNDSNQAERANGSVEKTSGDSEEGTIKIDTKLVNLNVSVMDRGGRAITNLKTDNFQLFEDGVQQQISHFETVNSPFNLVLLIDLSGSIIDKIDILRRAAIRFIEVTRPEDRVAVVTFTRNVQVVCELTNDRQLLRQRLRLMHMPKGGTAFYESLWFTLDQILQPVEGERNAIVLLSDGVDNSISVTYPIPSRVTFDQVLRKLQESGTLLFPIYLDTEYENVEQEIESPESYALARKQLAAMAEASGGVFIRAARVEHLEGIYEKVAADLRTLYSLAYYPTNATRDGSWRKLKVKVDKSDVAVRTRRGYYAK